MLGVPAEDLDKFKRWSDDFAAFIGEFTMSMERALAVQESIVEFAHYFRGIAAERRVEPRDDLLSALVTAEIQGDKLTEEELLANCILLLAAGHETTTNLIGNGLLALLRNPDQLDMLKSDPSLIVGAVEELLRYDSPVQLTGRRAREECEIEGKPITAGQEVLLLIGAANRDPACFSDPDRLDITRRDNRHLSFAHGPHFCLGAPLARLEGQVTLISLLQRFPKMSLAVADKEMQWRKNQALRGLEALPISL
jgi:cytochrome P450